MTTSTAIDHYVRVGTTYYRYIKRPTHTGSVTTKLVPWNRQTIIQDHGKFALATIPYLDGFVNVPDNTDHQRIIKTFVNLAGRMHHEPAKSMRKDGCKATLDYFAGIFGEHAIEAFDYLKLAVERPHQKLPALLITGPRGVGKTTFLKYLHTLFEGASNLATEDEFLGGYNDDSCRSQMVCVDGCTGSERLFEHVRALNSADRIVMNQKGLDQVVVDWYAKLAIVVMDYALVDLTSTSTWVVKLCMNAERNTANVLGPLKEEIPQFLAFLRDRSLATAPKTRHWFPPMGITTVN